MTYAEYVEMSKTTEGKKKIFSINCKNIIDLHFENKIDKVEAACRIYETGLTLGVYKFPEESEMLKIIRNHKKAKRR